MKKLKDWCNKNSGFLAFWGIVLMLIVWIFPPVNLELPKLLKIFDRFLTYSISIPVYGLIVFFILLIIVFYNRIGSWNKLVIKSVQNKVIEIVSDYLTVFVGSTSYPELKGSQNSFEFLDGGYWNGNPQFSELAPAKWISHTKLITDIEAIKGGVYQFRKDFELECHPNKIESAVIYFIADDFCNIRVNNKDIGKFWGFASLNKIEIKDKLVRGKNTIVFDVTNNDGAILSTPQYEKYTNSRGTLNPYGLKFNLRILKK